MSQKNQGGIKFNGKAAVIDMLKVADPEFRSRLIDGVSRLDPQMGKELQSGVFQFSDLMKMEVKDLQALLSKTHFEVLEIAARGASEPLLRKIQAALSTRMGEDLEESIVRGAKKKRSEVMKAQQMICDLALDMEQRGTIRLQRENDQWV
jgi:flagellar motor switch protein FliG